MATGSACVFVDLSTLPPDGSSGGAARFTLSLLDALLSEPEPLDLHLLARPEAEKALAPLVARGAVLHPLGPGLDAEEPRRIRRTLRRRAGGVARLLPDRGSLRRHGADVLFSPLFTALFHEPRVPHVAIAYDFQELSFPQFFDERELRRRAAFRADLLRADRVVAISSATRDDAVARAGLQPGKVVVVPPIVGAPLALLDAAQVAATLAGLGLVPGGFAFYPANYWPHKNHERLLAAAARARGRVPGLHFVLCGALDDARTALAARADALGLRESVRLLPYIGSRDVAALLQGARFLVYPSLFEGFGIPVLEAMGLGTPVTCSRLPSLREIAGDDALFFDPADEVSIADALELLWTGEETRRRLAAGGRARAATWAAIDTVGAYRRLLAFDRA
jgi:glycosyltransferase involved in cell wall biosynthesis